MEYQMKPGQGSLFKNTSMREGKKDANLTGKIMLPDGSVHYLNAWTNTKKDGEKWISISVGRPVGVVDSHNAAKANGYQPQKQDDDIPF